VEAGKPFFSRKGLLDIMEPHFQVGSLCGWVYVSVCVGWGVGGGQHCLCLLLALCCSWQHCTLLHCTLLHCTLLHCTLLCTAGCSALRAAPPFTWYFEVYRRAAHRALHCLLHVVCVCTFSSALPFLSSSDYLFAMNGAQLVHEEDVPFLIREHARKFQWGCSHGTVWRRR
jgi:hypothetical protein